jgi:hypothetical protein
LPRLIVVSAPPLEHHPPNIPGTSADFLQQVLAAREHVDGYRRKYSDVGNSSRSGDNNGSAAFIGLGRQRRRRSPSSLPLAVVVAFASALPLVVVIVILLLLPPPFPDEDEDENEDDANNSASLRRHYRVNVQYTIGIAE